MRWTIRCVTFVTDVKYTFWAALADELHAPAIRMARRTRVTAAQRCLPPFTGPLIESSWPSFAGDRARGGAQHDLIQHGQPTATADPAQVAALSGPRFSLCAALSKNLPK